MMVMVVMMMVMMTIHSVCELLLFLMRPRTNLESNQLFNGYFCHFDALKKYILKLKIFI